MKLYKITFQNDDGNRRSFLAYASNELIAIDEIRGEHRFIRDDYVVHNVLEYKSDFPIVVEVDTEFSFVTHRCEVKL